MATTVYCDEAGYTGDDLQSKQQPYFTYAGVALEAAESAEIVQEVRRLTRTQAPELKGKQIYAHSTATRAVALVIERLNGRAAYVTHDKAYALGAKFFEYALEPALSNGNSFFYGVGFHQFIAHVMYLFLASDDADAEAVLNHFVEMMRRKSNNVPGLFTNSLRLTDNPRSIMMDIMRLVRSDQVRRAVEEELDDISNEQGRIMWMLDLSRTSAAMVLRHLSAQYGALTVIMDESKPLAASVEFLNGLGTVPLATLSVPWADGLPFNYQLSTPIQFATSATEPGLQLADLVASLVTQSLQNSSASKAQHILELLLPLACTGNVVPDLKTLDFANPEARFNANLLTRLVDRAEANIPLLAPGLLD